MAEREFDAFGEMAVITDFIKLLSTSLPLPLVHCRMVRIFESKLSALTAKLALHKTQLDLTEFAAPINHLTEPGMADAAFTALDQFVIAKAGTTLGFLFQDLLDESLSDFRNQYERLKAQQAEKPTDNSLLSFETTAINEPMAEERAQHRRHNEKTRPACGSAYDIGTRVPTITQAGNVEVQ
jgi:hypothetical protein